MFLHVSKAKYVGAFKIEVTFSDGRVGVADLTASLNGPVFAALKDPKEFSRFAVDKELGTIAWENGADMAPEYLYFQAFKNQTDLQPLFRQWGYQA